MRETKLFEFFQNIADANWRLGQPSFAPNWPGFYKGQPYGPSSEN